MGMSMQQHPILEGSRLPFIRIANDKPLQGGLVDRAKGIFFGTFVTESPLPGRLETRAAAPAQAGLIQRFKNGLSPLLENLANGSARLQISLQQQGR